MKSQQTISILEKHLGIPGQYNAQWTGRRLLKEIWKQKPAIVRDCTEDLRDIPGNPFNQSARDILYRRDLTLNMIGQWVHHFDKNSAYLSACRGANMGIGNPVHLTDENITPGLPGIYRVTVKPYVWDCYDDVTLPAGIDIIEPDQEWITSDVLIYARSRGHEITIHEAYVFEDYTKILDKWALKIWDTRQAILAEYGKEHPAYDEMKLIALIAVGAFAIGKEKQPTLEMVHPNWWADAVGKARVNMLCNLEKYAGAGFPVLVYSDGVFYTSRDENYYGAVPGILERQGKLGGYKHVYSFQITRELIEQAQGLEEGQLVTLFHKYGKHETGVYDG